MRRASWLSLLLVAPLLGCHLIFPFDLQKTDALVLDASADGRVLDDTAAPDGRASEVVVIQPGQQVHSFSLALDGSGRAHLVYLLQGDLRHAVVEQGEIASDGTLDAGVVDAASTAINDQDMMLVVYSKLKDLQLWRTSRDLSNPTSPWTSPKLDTSQPAAYDTIELTATGSSFYGGCTGLDASNQKRLILMHIGTQAVGCGMNLNNPPAPVRVAAGAGYGALSLQHDKQWHLVSSKLASDATFCGVTDWYSFTFEPPPGPSPLPLVVDSKSTIHAVRILNDQLQQWTWDINGSLLSSQNLFSLSASSQASLDLAIDSQDRIHILFQEGGQLFWRHSTAPGVWTEAKPVSATFVARPMVRIRGDKIGFAYSVPGGGVGVLLRQLP